MTDTWVRRAISCGPGYNNCGGEPQFTVTYDSVNDRLIMQASLPVFGTADDINGAGEFPTGFPGWTFNISSGNFSIQSSTELWLDNAWYYLVNSPGDEATIEQMDFYDPGAVLIGTWIGSVAITEPVLVPTPFSITPQWFRQDVNNVDANCDNILAPGKHRHLAFQIPGQALDDPAIAGIRVTSDAGTFDLMYSDAQGGEWRLTGDPNQIQYVAPDPHPYGDQVIQSVRLLDIGSNIIGDPGSSQNKELADVASCGITADGNFRIEFNQPYSNLFGVSILSCQDLDIGSGGQGKVFYDPTGPNAGANIGQGFVSVEWSALAIEFECVSGCVTSPINEWSGIEIMANDGDIQFAASQGQFVAYPAPAAYVDVMEAADLAAGLTFWHGGLAADTAAGQVALGIPRDGADGFMAAVVNSAGELDTFFDTDGRVVEDFGFGSITSTAAFYDEAGLLYVAGTHDVAGDNKLGIARFNTDGTIDGTFGSGGFATHAFAASYTLTDMFVVPNAHPDADGAIVLVANDQGSGNVVLLSFTPAGVFDDAANLGPMDRASLVMQTVAPHNFYVASRLAGDWHFERIDLNSNLSFSSDPTFDGDGIATVDFGYVSGIDHPRIATDSSGRVLISSSAFVVDHDQWLVGRLTLAGAADATFGGGDGVIEIDVPDLSASATTYGQGIDVQSDGKIIAAGLDVSGEVSAATRVVLVRLDTAGAVDATFGTAGFAFFDPGFAYNDDVEIVVMDDDTIVLKAYVGGTDDVHLARFSAAGVQDPTYNG